MRIILLSLALALAIPSFAQVKIVEPDAEDIQTAKSLQAKHEDANVAIQESTDYITFKLNKKAKQVDVHHIRHESFIGLAPTTRVTRVTFYDGESTITQFSTLDKNQKSVDFKVEDEAYSSDGIFHSDSRVKYVNIYFSLAGQRFFMEQKKEYRDIKYFTAVYFDDVLPTANKEIQIEVPEWLDVELKEMNFESYAITKNVALSKDQETRIYTYKLKDIEARSLASNAPGISYIYPHILILPKSFTIEGEKTPIFNSTQDLYNWYKSLIASLENDSSPFEEKVRELTEEANTDDEKIKNIYYWVQDNIRYIAFEDGIAGFKPDEAANVFTKRYGDCKGMANLLKRMLIEAGFDARLTWIGTKNIAYDYSTPNLSVDNHMICALIVDDTPVFLDATEKFSPFGEYAYRIQGKQALIENGFGYVLEEVPSTTESSNKERITYNFKIEGNTIVGNSTQKYSGESRTSLLNYFNSIKNDHKEDFLEWYLSNGNSNIKVNNIETSDLSNRDSTLSFAYQVTINNAVSVFDDDLYVDLDNDKELIDLKFSDRKVDYLFNYKKDLESITTLRIPEGYELTHLPETVSVSNKNYELSAGFTQTADTITYKKHFIFKNARIEAQDFEAWNQFNQKLKTMYNEQIIFAKK